MNNKNDVEVIINNKRYTLCGYESAEYIQKIATYLNNKFSEFKLQDGYSTLDTDTKSIFMALNIADDFFKAQKQVAEISMDVELKDKEIFDMKHEMISMQTRLESAESKLKQMKEEYDATKGDIIRLETELKAAKEMKAAGKQTGSGKGK